MITEKDVEHVAWLARLSLRDEEKDRFRGQLNDVLEYFQVLDEVPEDLDPTYHVLGLQNVFRKDEPDEDRMLSQEDALANAPRTEKGYFKGPRIV